MRLLNLNELMSAAKANTQASFSKKIEVSARTISRWASGKNIDFSQVAKLVKKIDMHVLVMDEDGKILKVEAERVNPTQQVQEKKTA